MNYNTMTPQISVHKLHKFYILFLVKMLNSFLLFVVFRL